VHCIDHFEGRSYVHGLPFTLEEAYVDEHGGGPCRCRQESCFVLRQGVNSAYETIPGESAKEKC